MNLTTLVIDIICLWGIIVVLLMNLVMLVNHVLLLRKDRIRRQQKLGSIKSKRAKPIVTNTRRKYHAPD